jgi:hypothetical protein
MKVEALALSDSTTLLVAEWDGRWVVSLSASYDGVKSTIPMANGSTRNEAVHKATLMFEEGAAFLQRPPA